MTISMLMMLAASAAHAEAERKSYIVQLVDKPAASYTGGVAGLAATRPATGQRLQVDAAEVQAYRSYLDQKQAEVLGSLSAAQVEHQYNIVFNGFSAMLTDDEARALKKNKAVARLSANVMMRPTTGYTSTFLGLDKPGGLWDQVGGKKAAGEDIVIGMLDTGVWPENPGFADRVDDSGAPVFEGGTLAYGPPPASWKGVCEPGQGFGPGNCNNKLIGARIFPPTDAKLSPYEYISIRDSDGHGTHTATTAAGAPNVSANVAGVPMGKIGGMAPRARLAIYKVCWTAAYDGGSQYQNSCPASSSVAAVEQAIKDGVNVISFSIGSSLGGGEFDEPTEQAFLAAANAGVFVSAAAGNEGPESEEPAPVTHISPWLTTVANSTHNRSYLGSVTLGNGVKLTGVSNNANNTSTPLLLARDAGKRGTRPDDIRVAQCFGPDDSVGMPLDLAKVKGKILVCDRGGNPLYNKVETAKAAGAAGVVIVNVDGGATTLLSQYYNLPTVHLNLADGKTLKGYVAQQAGKGTASLGDVRPTYDTNPAAAPIVAGSSSRGPNVADANILKPDIAAPGTDILAGYLPDMPTVADFEAPYTGGKMPLPAWAFLTGTSMATPHISGIAAMLKQLHPEWSPAAVKSALMTTAFDTQSDGRNSPLAWDNSARDTGKLPWAQGAGQAAPNPAADPGLVYDVGAEDYRRFLCGQVLRTAPDCSGATPLAAYDLNLPSLSAAAVMGNQTLHRTVTNVGKTAATYTASASLPGFKVEVQPATLVLGAGAKGDFSVKLTRIDAAMHTWQYGALTWNDGNGHKVRSALTARAVALDTAPLIYSEATDGAKVTTLRSGFTGQVGLVKSALQPASQADSSIIQMTDRDYITCPWPADGLNVSTVVIPSGTMIARFALFNADTSGEGQPDLDLYLANADGLVIQRSDNGGSDEMITMVNPAPGEYRLCVAGYSVPGGSANYKLSTWLVPPDKGANNLKVATPGVVYTGKSASVAYSWSGLDAGKRYLGMTHFLNAGVVEAATMLEVDTTDPLPSFRFGRARSNKRK
jgi:hypothetical protein